MSPIITGLLGGLIAAMLLPWLLKSSPYKLSKGQRRYVRKKYKRHVLIANILMPTSLILGFILLKLNIFPNNELHVFLIAFGLMGGLPLIVFSLPAKDGTRNFTEALTAYSMSHKSPVWLIQSILIFFIILGVLGVYLYFA